MSSIKHAFISYGRKESKAFATRLHDRLCQEGYEVWFDQNDIPLGVDFQDEIDEGIARADNFIYVIAPHAVNSPYCLKEVELALKFKKRIIPILHIEAFGKAVWQERFPYGTQEDWDTFQAEGRHSSFEHMHPEIGKRNWVYMRENCTANTPIEKFAPIDDFEENFLGLLKLLQHHADYVRTHTELLTRALLWEANKRTSQFLLVGQERQEAEEWMLRKFTDEQAPVIPSDLHCEYISDARKNAENRMTDVFICYASEDKTIRDQIIIALSRYCVTTWTHDRDILSGQTFQDAIEEGIEKADNILFFISPHAVNSPHCLDELKHAQMFNKRIIPLLIAETSEEELPEQIRNLQYVDFTDNRKAEDFYQDIDKLINQLDTDRSYHERHKMLLVQALKWERQGKNPSILLRGHNLQRAQAWLKLGIQRKNHLPTAQHEVFIEESATQRGSLQSIDIFVSYSRKDSDFARQLNDRLQLSGKTTWFDQENIEAGAANFGEEIRKGIEQSDNFLFIISPDSVSSPYCADEVAYAQELSKRFITLRLRSLPDDLQLPEALADVQWIDAKREFEPMYNLLVRALEVDRQHVAAHSRWQRKALDWSGNILELKKDTPTDDSLLLRGSELEAAESWIAESRDKKPAPTPLQERFIRKSQDERAKEETRKSRIMDLSILAFALIIAGAVLAGTQWAAAVKRGDRLASYNLLFEAQNLLEIDSIESLRLSKAAYEISKERNTRILQDHYMLAEAYFATKGETTEPLFRRFPHKAPVIGFYSSQMPSANLVTLDAGKGLKLWDKNTGKLIKTLLPTGKSSLNFYNQSAIEKLDLLYVENIKNFSTVVLDDLNNVGAFFHHANGSTVYLWDNKGELLFKRNIPEKIHSLGFSSSINHEPQFHWVVRESDYEGLQTFVNYRGEFIYEEKTSVYDPVYGGNDLLFSTATYENVYYAQTEKDKILDDSKLSFASDGSYFTLSHRDTSETGYAEERFAILGLPFFWNERILVLTPEEGAILWKPYFTFAQKLSDIPTLTLVEKVRYDIATFTESFAVDEAAAYQLTKVLFFLLFFFLSIIVLNIFYYLFNTGRYLSLVFYTLSLVVIAICWTHFLDYHAFMIALATTYSLILSGFGLWYTWRNRGDKDWFKLVWRLTACTVLSLTALTCLFFSRKIFFEDLHLLNQSVSLILYLALAKLAVFGSAYAGLRKFYQGLYRWLPDLGTVWVFTVILFLITSYYFGPSDTGGKDSALVLFFLVFMPLLYVVRLNAKQFAVLKLENKRSSRRLLRFTGYGFLFVVFITIVGLVIDGESLFLFAIFCFALYLLVEYIASFVVAIVQKDRFSLFGNIGASFGLAVLLILWTTDSISRQSLIQYFPYLLGVVILILGTAWWVVRRRKTLVRM